RGHRPFIAGGVLDEFAAGIAGDGTVVEKGYLGSVKVLGEGVDTARCDSVYFADVRGSMPDLVQAVGRALRIQPGEGKIASLVVPVLLGPEETADNMLTSRAYGGLAKLLEALRAHDTRIVEALAEQQAPSRTPKGRELGGEGEGQEQQGAAWQGVSSPAKALLKFSTPRDPAQLAAFINLRVLNPEHQHWRRGIEAATIYHRLHGDLRVPFTYRVPTERKADAENEAPGSAAGEGELVWPASLANFPLGQWTADARRFYARGNMDADRVIQLEKLSMIWSHYDVAWEEGLTAAHGWAAENGHLLAPLDATHQGYKVGIWLKNQRAAARRGAELEQRRAEGLPVQSSAGALSTERREQLEEIDASWCPAWPVAWQRAFHLTRLHLDTGGTLPTTAGNVVHQREDLGHWVTAQRVGWDKLSGVQQWMLEHILGITPASEDEKPKPRTSQADKWALHLTAAQQYYQREGHLHVPRKHVETITINSPNNDDGENQEQRETRLGAWVSNQRTRAATLTPKRIEQLTQIGMRWT
ncbi:Helicase associated domain protein, partial [Streptomyces sp. LN499]|uniref:helicase associated domain-containing protein n=1 Tax=Streptomyces sp. LN499 TaxID=3112977 RepID=UPI00371844B4